MGLRSLFAWGAFTLAALTSGGCVANSSKDYISQYLSASPTRQNYAAKNDAKNAFDSDDATDASVSGKQKLILDTHHSISENRIEDNISAKCIQDLGKDCKLIIYAADSYSGNEGELRDYFTNSARFQASIGKYLEAGKDVLVYVELGGRAEIFSYASCTDDMKYATGMGALKAGLVRCDEGRTKEPTTKIQADILAGAGKYDWDFGKTKLDEKIYQAIAQVQAMQKLPISIKKIDRINLVANASYALKDHDKYFMSQIGVIEGGLEVAIEESVLGAPARLKVFGGARNQLTNPEFGDSTSEWIGRGGLKLTTQLLEDTIQAFIEADFDGKNGFGVGGGVKITFGGK